MRTRQPLRRTCLAAILAVCLGASADAEAAGLFDAIGSIFGAGPDPWKSQPAPRGFEGGEGLSVTVRPRRPRPKRERAIVRTERTAPVATLNLDPAKNPGWYLDDPTLRRGDIVVLKGEVLVFEGTGRGPHAREDFTSLESSGLSRAERDRVAGMAGLPPADTPLVQAPRKTVTALPD